MKRTAFFILACIALLIASSPATAQSPQRQPNDRESYLRAVQDGRYDDVAATLRASLARAYNPVQEGALAQVLVLAGHFAEAREVAARCQHASDSNVAAVCNRVLATTAHLVPPPVAPTAAPAVQVPAETPTARTPSVVPVAVRIPRTSSRRTLRPSVGPIALASVAVASLVTASVLAALRADALAACAIEGETARCPNQRAMEHAQASVDLTTAANVALVTGASALVAGVTWYALGGRELAVVPVVTADTTTLTLTAAF